MKQFTIDGKNCSTKSILFEIFKTELDFPDYFSQNWDSFDEVMSDLSWVDETQIQINIIDYALLLSKEKEEDLDILFDILSNVEEFSGKTLLIEIEENKA